MRAVLATALAFSAALVAVVVTAPTAEARPCGFSKQGRTGYHNHCGNTLILVKFHWSNGATGTTCQGGGEIPFYPDGPHEVVNAYYVNKRPSTMVNANGVEICRTGQPSA